MAEELKTLVVGGFRIGDPVEMSELGRANFRGVRTGTVVGFGRGLLIRVRKTGQKTSSAWHVDFWRVADAGSQGSVEAAQVAGVGARQGAGESAQ